MLRLYSLRKWEQINHISQLIFAWRNKLLRYLFNFLNCHQRCSTFNSFVLLFMSYYTNWFFLTFNIDFFVIFIQYVDWQFEGISIEMCFYNNLSHHLFIHSTSCLLRKIRVKSQSKVIYLGIFIIFKIILQR